MLRSRARPPYAVLKLVADLSVLHQRYEEAPFIADAWNGLVFKHFTDALDARFHTLDQRVRVALRLFIDGFRCTKPFG